MAVSPPVARLRPGTSRWPELLDQIPDPPAWLDVSGHWAVLGAPCLAIVGTRRATARGLAVARGLALQAVLQGWTVISGLALGIDAAAHDGALAGGGITVGVMATGLDRTYPSRHRDLRRRMERRGCVLTEFPAGTRPLKHHFPRRNRLIAGLARAVLVVEAPLRSGAMITARLALDYNREVMAVPGPVDSEVSRGCHELLRQGATLVESWADVAAGLGTASGIDPEGSTPAMPASPAPDGAAAWILARLDLDGVPRDDLRRDWPGSEDCWQEGLLVLEISGLIRRLPGGRLARSIWSA